MAYQAVEDEIRYRRMAAKDGTERLNAYAALLASLHPFLGKKATDDGYLFSGELGDEEDEALRSALTAVFEDVELIASRPGMLSVIELGGGR